MDSASASARSKGAGVRGAMVHTRECCAHFWQLRDQGEERESDIKGTPSQGAAISV